MKKFLVIGTGDSVIHYTKMDIEIPHDIKIIGMHRAFPYFKENAGIEFDYWTWSDPDASIDGLRIYMNTSNGDFEKLPQIILPYYQKNLNLFDKNCGTSPLYVKRERAKDRVFYENSVKRLDELGKITWIENAINTKTIPTNHDVFTDASVRFNGKHTYFGSVPYDGRRSNTDWAQENKFTAYMLPIAHYLKATHVFCLGFDNCGKGILRKQQFLNHSPGRVLPLLLKYKKWTHDWVDYHKMNIFSVVEDKFSPNNLVMEYLPIDKIDEVKENEVTPFLKWDNLKTRLTDNLKNIVNLK